MKKVRATRGHRNHQGRELRSCTSRAPSAPRSLSLSRRALAPRTQEPSGLTTHVCRLHATRTVKDNRKHAKKRSFLPTQPKGSFDRRLCDAPSPPNTCQPGAETRRTDPTFPRGPSKTYDGNVLSRLDDMPIEVRSGAPSRLVGILFGGCLAFGRSCRDEHGPARPKATLSP